MFDGGKEGWKGTEGWYGMDLSMALGVWGEHDLSTHGVMVELSDCRIPIRRSCSPTDQLPALRLALLPD